MEFETLAGAGAQAGERLKLFPRLTYKAAGMAAMVALLAGVTSLQARDKVTFASQSAAFMQGLSAYKGRDYAIAVPALAFAADHGVMRAKFYLAKIYSDNSGGWTDHGRAYGLLREIVKDHSRVDPKDFRVAPYVAKALISIARYERDGIRALNIAPNTQRALKFFDHAASYFDDEDAQFELAKHYLSGDGVEMRVRYALNWLAKLSKGGHAGAQAFLANLYWDGRYLGRDPVRALALITVAAENAGEEDRFWIEDVHQNIFCQADARSRGKVRDIVDGWRQRYGRTTVSHANGDELGRLGDGVQRTCANGDVVGVFKKQEETLAAGAVLGGSGTRGVAAIDRSATDSNAERMSRTKQPEAGFSLRPDGSGQGRDVMMGNSAFPRLRLREVLGAQPRVPD